MKNLFVALLRWVAIAPLSAGIVLGHSVATRADDLALNFDLSPRSPKPTVEQTTSVESTPSTNTALPQVKPLEVPTQATAIPVGVSDHAPATLPPPPPQPISTPSTLPAPAQDQDIESRLFEGGSDSLVSRAVGSAEGTRTPDGHHTPAYYGHVDPGNGVWNLGSFSYQHGASSPEEADTKQLARLRQQAQTLQQKAIARNLELTLEEKLNGIDLANQAPMAALGREGYIDWLDQAHKMGMRGTDAILWARTRSFLDPDTSEWEAPGLGNNLHRISSDQERRLLAIARAIEANHHRSKPSPMLEPTQPDVVSQPSQENAEEEAIARLFAQEVPPAFTPAPDAVQPKPATTAPASDIAPNSSTVDAILDLDLPEKAEPDLGG